MSTKDGGFSIDMPLSPRDGGQPPRGPEDGAVNLKRERNAPRLVLEVEQDGKSTRVVMSEHNAWRAFGLLAVVLGIKLPAKLAKGIKL